MKSVDLVGGLSASVSESVFAVRTKQIELKANRYRVMKNFISYCHRPLLELSLFDLQLTVAPYSVESLR